MDREEALSLIRENVKNENLLKHMLAVEAIMKGLAEHFGEDPQLWGMAGLLHDVDFEKTETNPLEHGIIAEGILQGKVDYRVLRAIKAHNYENTKVALESKMDRSLIAADSVSGLIIACALVMPSKRLMDVKVETVRKKFKDKDFARGSSRERMLMCESMDLPKEKLFEVALKSLQGISEQLGL